ncbi:MAG TPA: T9SS type A sorting domain-containing protein [bacterium]|nr:T9SS type A sorting domain-containing protein [bacterium]
MNWNKSTDAETPQDGLTYNIRVGKTSAGVDVMSPMAKVVGSGNAGGFRYVQESGNTSHNNSWRLSGLSDGTYYWSVEAIDQVYRNSKFQSAAQFTIDGAPSAPDSLSVTSGVNSVTLMWGSTNKSDVSKYFIYVSADNEGYTLVDSTTTGIFGTTKTVTKGPSGGILQNGSIYYFRVEAMDHNGYVGPYSNYVTAIPSATPGKWFVVNSDDYGPGSLRSAIDSTNLSTQKDTVVFLIPIGSSITLNSELPAISTDYTVIDADSNDDGKPDVSLSPIGEGGGFFYGLTIQSSNNLIQGLVIGGFGDYYSGGGSLFINGDNNRILGNYIGVSSDGMSTHGNNHGILINGGSSGNWIGDGTGTGRNIIGGNQQYGIYLNGASTSVNNTKILGNYIGIATDGLTALPNSGPGISIYNRALNTIIGNGTAEGRNIISGNSSDGILLTDNNGHIEGTSILGNYIGTDVTGSVGVGNNNHGIFFNTLTGEGASIVNNTIGDGTAGGRNVISGNAGSGINFYYYQVHDNTIKGNYIGITADGSAALGNGMYGVNIEHSNNNIVSSNTISGNAYDGIMINGSYGEANNNVVTGNYVGTNPTGSFAIANGQRGIYLQNGASYNQIGGTAAGEGNIVSGNLNGGIGFGAAYTPTVSNQILGNKIGTDATGMFGIPNKESGIYINGSNHNYNYIGDGTTGGRNIISGNDGDGIYIYGSASDNFILGNYIGVDATGNTGLANDSNGIAIYNSGHILIGDETAGGRNIISGNGKEGIAIYAQSTEIVIGDGGNKALVNDAGGRVAKPELPGANNIDIRGNYIGVGTNGSTSLGNGGAGIEIEAVFEGFYSQYDSITSNLIAYNTNGIELVGAGVSSTYIHNNTIYGNTADGIAIEEGAQNGVTTPAITSISDFVVSGTASVGAMVYVYQDAGNQGRYYLGSSAADGEGSWSYNGLYLPGYNVTATQFLDEQSSAFSAPFATPSGTIHATTTSLSYGNVLAGDSATLTTRIYAIGNPVVMNSGSLVLGTNAQMLATLGTDTLFMTDTITVQVRFKPVNFGFLTDTLRIYYGEGNMFDIRIGGTGTSGTIAASSIGFAMETLNGDSTSVPIQMYTTSGWVQLNSATFGQNNYFTYSIDKTLPYIMKPGDTAGVTVTFKPTTFTNSADTLYFANNSSDGILELMFSGLPLPGTVATNLASQDFGNVLLGDSLELTTKIYAPSGRVEITSVTLSQGDVLSMTVTPALPFTLNAGDTILVKTKFIPSDFNSFNDTITVLSNASNGTVTVSLSGQSLPGTISSAASAFDFGNVLVGDSAQTSTRYYATGGPVQITGSSLVTSGETSVSFTPSLPYLLHVGDSVVVTAKYKPLTFAAMSADTIHLISNASNSGKLSIPMSGFGQTGTLTFNTTPANFGSIRVADSSTAQIVKVYSSVGQIPLTGYTIGSHFKATTSTVFPITIKSGDTVTLAVKFKPQTTGALLDTIKIGNVRIPLAGTGLENVAPTLTLGVTSVIALKQYLGIYMYSSEALSARSAAFKFNDVSVTAPTFDVVSGVNNLYYAQYKLSAAGSLKIDATGTDIAGNIGTRSKTYTIGSLTKDQTLAVEAEGLRISGAKGAIGESGFMIITKSQTYDGDPVGLAKGTSKSATDFANANIQSWDIISTVALEKSVTLTAVYDETWIHALQTQYANFDERKIGFYREENGSLVYLGGEGRNGNVALQTKSLGKFVIQYNDEHRYLPSEITLAQNYPNPFNPTTTIEFGLPEASHVKLVVYNILGQRVAELFNGQRNEGYHKFVWNGRNAQGATVASGVYLYRLETNKGNVTKKMMFIK